MDDAYWDETVEIALNEVGIKATKEQIETIAGAMAVSHEQYDTAYGYDVVSCNNAGEKDREIRRLTEELEAERNKRMCEDCNGKGYTMTHGGTLCSPSECFTCKGAGRC